MLQWFRSFKRHSRRPNRFRPRVLRIDELENRWLLSSAPFGYSPEQLLGGEYEFEIGDGFDAHESSIVPQNATLSYFPVFEHGEREDDDHEEHEDDRWEHEDDVWEHEDEYWLAAVLVDNAFGNGQALAADFVADDEDTDAGDDDTGKHVDEYSLPAVLVNDAFGNGQVIATDPVAEGEGAEAEDDGALVGSIGGTTDEVEDLATTGPTTSTSPTRATQDDIEEADPEEPDLGEADHRASETIVEETHETLSDGNDEERVTDPSAEQVGLASLDAETEEQSENDSDANQPELQEANAAEVVARDNVADEENGSFSPSPKGAVDAGDTSEVPGFGLDGARQDPSTEAENPDGPTTRRVQLPSDSGDVRQARLFASSVTEFRNGDNWRLRDVLPQDLAALERALQNLLADGREMGRNLTDWFMRPEVLRWIAVISVALIAAETARRQAQRSQSNDDPPADEGQDVSLRLFPELFGLPPGTE